MKVITALENCEITEPLPKVFCAGGITGCWDWQSSISAMLAHLDFVLLNPRRPNFPMDIPEESAKQIGWEHRHLKRADAILFWFPPESLCPITPYELGYWSAMGKPLFVGAHPEYKRRLDVLVQTSYCRADVRVRENLLEVAADVERWLKAT